METENLITVLSEVKRLHLPFEAIFSLEEVQDRASNVLMSFEYENTICSQISLKNIDFERIGAFSINEFDHGKR